MSKITAASGGTTVEVGTAGGDFIIDNTDADKKIVMRLGTDTSATAFEVRNNSDAVKFGVGGDGSFTGLPVTGVANGVDNRIATFSSASALNGEANLTFDATTLAVTGKQTITPANDVGGAALTITNQDTDQIALDINASNIDANVIDIVDAVTTSDVINISADALTTGEVLKINSNSSNSSSRRLIEVRNDNTAATGTTPLMVWNDAATGSSAADVYIIGTTNSPNDGPSLRLHRNPVHTTTHSCNINSNTTVDGISATTDIRAGMAVSGTDIPAGAYVVSVTDGGSGTTAFVLSDAATATATGRTLTFTGSGNSDYLGDVQFYGEDRGGSDQEYANLTARIQSTKVGDEAGALFFNIKNAGNNSTMIYATGNENGGGSVTVNYSGHNIDFRVKGDNETDLLFCDAGNDRVGLATSSPKNILQVNVTGADSVSMVFRLLEMMLQLRLMKY